MQATLPRIRQFLSANALRLAAIASVSSFILFLAHQAWHFPSISDDIFVATTAKNAAFGHGWVSSYGELLPFDPEISTGPGLLGALALGIKLFGNTLWLPRVFSLGLNLLLAALLLWRLRPWLPQRAFLWLLVLLPLTYANIRHDMWITALGDMPVVLYSALAAVLVFEGMERGDWRHLFAGGMVAGLALLTKAVALMPVTGILLLPWLYAVLQMPAPKPAWRQWPWLLAGLALPVLPWLVYQQSVISALPEAQAVYLQQESRRVFLHMGSGLGRLLEAWQGGGLTGVAETGLRNLLRNIPRFNQEIGWKLGPLPWPFVLFLGLLALAVVWGLRHRQQARYRLLLTLLLPAIPYLVWLVLASDWIFGRHANIGVLLGLLGLLLIASQRQRLAAGLSTYLALLALLWPVADINFGKLYRIHTEAHPVQQPLQRFIALLERDYPEARLAGCGYQIAREVEYALPSVNRVVDCHRLIGDAVTFDYPAFIARYPDLDGLDRNAALQHFIADRQRLLPRGLIAPIHWDAETEFILIDYPVARLFGQRDGTTLGSLIPYCSNTLYNDTVYALHHCSAEDLKAYVNARGGIGFAPPQWQLQLWLEARRPLAGLPAQQAQ